MGYDYGLNYWGAPVVGPLLFVAITCFLGTFLTWVTLRSGSVWPACLAHAVNNSLAMLMAAFGSGEPDNLIGPACVGIIGSLGYAVLAQLIFFSPRALAQSASGPVDLALSENLGAVGKAAHAQ
jgi:membrane protease YdiL (CAAX protease family)